MRRAAAGVGAVAIAVLAPTMAAAQNGPALRLYAETGFAGDSHRVDRGVESLNTVRFGDRARSVIAEGRWELCLDAEYRGECRVVQGRVSDMGDWNDRVSSVRYLGPSDWGAGGEAAGAQSGEGALNVVPAQAGPAYRVDYRPEMIGRLYDTPFGRVVLERFDRGGAAGRYSGNASDGADAGTFDGAVQPADDPTTGHDRVEGYWYAQTASQRCGSPRNGTYYWGRIQFNFLRENNDYIGFYGHCEGTALDGWSGTYAGRDPAIEAAVNAQLAGQAGQQVVAVGQPGEPVDAQGRPVPGLVDRAARVAGDEAERQIHDRIREGVGRIF